jgi:protein-disulfide isomerase
VNENKTTLVDKDSHILGNVNAPVTIIEFADLLCPSCQQTYPVLEDLVKKSDGRVRVVFHHFPLFMKEDHKMALPAATIAEMASEEGKFWDFLAAMYSRPQAELQTMESIVDVSRSVGLNSETVMKRMNNPKDPAIQRVTDDLNLANKIKIRSTPTLFIQAHDGPIEQVPTSLLEDKLNTEPYKSLILGAAPAK